MSSSSQQFSHLKSPVMRNLSHTPSSASSPYLPGYLFGASSPATPQTNSNHHKMHGTPSSHHLPSKAPVIGIGENNVFHSPSQFARDHQRPLESDKIMTRKDKSGAPPTESLYTTKKHSSSSGDETAQQRHQGNDINNFEETLRSHFHPEHHNDSESMKSPAQIDPFFAEGDSISSGDIMEETAITIFGFPPSACSFIIQQFSQYGKIEKYEVHNQGNWMHVKYQTKLQAKKALSKNGKIFARTMMVGVCTCIKKDIANLEATYNMTTELNRTPVPGMKRQSSTSIRSLSSSSNMSSAKTLAPMSPLVDKNTPQKKDTMISRTLDYVFGL